MGFDGYDTYKSISRPGKFEIHETPKGNFIFKLIAGNGKVLVTSTPCHSKAACENGVSAVQRCASTDVIIDYTTKKS